MTRPGRAKKQFTQRHRYGKQLRGFFGKFRQRLQDKMEEMQKKAAEQSARQIKNPNRQEPFKNPNRDKKKKRK